MKTVGRMLRTSLVAASALPLSLVLASSASAAECTASGVGSLLSSCNQPTSSPQPAPSPAPQPAPPSAPQPAPQPAGDIAEEPGAAIRLLDLVNKDRASAGLTALASRSQIASIAQGHSTAMAGRRTIWHNDAYFTAATRRSLDARALGENVAMNGSVDDAHRRLMASPGHRANILNGAFDAVGISVVHDEHGRFYVTQNFVDSAAGASTVGAAAPAPAKAAVKRAPSPAVASAAKPVIAAPVVTDEAALPIAPIELDLADQGAAPASTDGSGSTGSTYGAVAAAITALLGALGALVRLG